VISAPVTRVIPTPFDNYGFAGCTVGKPCKLSCQGDCDTDNDCVSPLTCKDRVANELPVLGCTGTPVNLMDYCFNAAYDSRKRVMVKFPLA
jgi:hypothetical protein